MSLEVAVAAPFKQEGRERLEEQAFVVALSLDRDWFSPDQAKRLVDVAVGDGLLAREGGELVAQFDLGAVAIPDEFQPAEDLLRERTPFERVLGDLVAAGHEKREAVAEINRLQTELGLTVEAAAVVYARREGVDVSGAAERARRELTD
ncbi:MAG: DUF2240 family protein [Halobacteriaceae archaeon]